MVQEGPKSEFFDAPHVTPRSKKNLNATTFVTTSVTKDNEENDERLNLTDEHLLRTGTNEDYTKF